MNRFVAITGSVGNLPKTEHRDIQYSQSHRIYTQRFCFSNAIKSEQLPTQRWQLISDDLKLLDQLHAW
jgi:hypothetical protein